MVKETEKSKIKEQPSRGRQTHRDGDCYNNLSGHKVSCPISASSQPVWHEAGIPTEVVNALYNRAHKVCIYCSPVIFAACDCKISKKVNIEQLSLWVKATNSSGRIEVSGNSFSMSMAPCATFPVLRIAVH